EQAASRQKRSGSASPLQPGQSSNDTRRDSKRGWQLVLALDHAFARVQRKLRQDHDQRSHDRTASEATNSPQTIEHQHADPTTAREQHDAEVVEEVERVAAWRGRAQK